MNDTSLSTASEVVDLTVPAARAQRDTLAARTDVLDKVKVLSMMPDDLHVTREMVANYFEVDVETIHKLVQRNRDELESNGLSVLRGQELVDIMSIANLDTRTRALTVFTRRTVLVTAMLLRDSPVARQLRTHLLDVEAGAREPVKTLTGLEYALALVDAERRAEAGEKFVRAIEGGNGIGLRVFHKKYFSDVIETDFFAHLYRRHHLIDQRGKGTLRTSGPKAGTYRNGSAHGHPGYHGKKWLYLHTPRTTGYRREEARVRPGRYELDFRDQLAAEGLRANENTAGLFGIDGAISKELA